MRLSRRSLFGWLGSAAVSLALRSPASAEEASPTVAALPGFTGPGANPYWNGVNPFVTYPQKLPLLRVTDRAVQLETPRPYFLSPFTPNAAFYVRYHLELIPNAIDLRTWRLSVEGNVERPLQIAFDDLVKTFRPVSVAAVNQCSGNSRSRFQPRVPGAQWGNGAMGNALWTGVRLKELHAAALTREDANYWMATAYRVPDTPRGNTTPADAAGGALKTVPIGHVRMPVRSFIVAPDGSSKLLPGLPVRVQGIAFSGQGPVVKVEFSEDDGRNWVE